MNDEVLGRLERVDLRNIWNSEPAGFTPWLAQSENLEILADTLGIELELEAQEKEVGPFRADILCKDMGTDSWVLVENQLERTDHTHLGQLLTYAAGLHGSDHRMVGSALHGRAPCNAGLVEQYHRRELSLFRPGNRALADR